jgi:CubicO group peptidase (beta-lactamase class C family)
VAVGGGALSLDDSICDQLVEYRGKDVCRIHVRHPLTFSSGLRWQETYEGAPYQESSVIAMLFGVGHRDQLRHILSGGLEADPGTQWRYSTGDAELLCAVVKRALEARFGPGAFWSRFFEPMGMDVVVEEDPRGTPLGGSSLYATPRDFAKLGWLYLNDGCWEGRRLLPDGWVKATTTPSPVFTATAADVERTPTGYAWWLNAPRPERSLPKPWPDAPDDAFAAEGHWGQLVIVIPSEELVIVRTGDDRDDDLSDDVDAQNTLIRLAREVAR